MSHAQRADKLLIKPAAGARPAPPHTRRRIIPKARTQRPVTRRATRGTATTRLATNPDRATRRLLQSPEGRARAGSRDLRVSFLRTVTVAFVTPYPKIELHVHLEGTVGAQTLRQIAK